MQEQEAAAAAVAAAAEIAPVGDVEVKGWRNGLLLILPGVGTWNEVMARVDARLDEAKARSFWRGAQTTIVSEFRAISLEELDALTERVKRAYGLVPVAIVATDAATRAAGEKLALVAYETLPLVRKPAPREYDAGGVAPGVLPAEPAAASSAPARAVEAPERVAPVGAAATAPENNALYLYQTVRSGQRIVHDGHLVICGDVNAGAEVLARGDVVVLGTLRGLAHAGYYGDETARIVAWSLRPPQLRIAGKIARSPEAAGTAKGTPAAAAQTPEVARIESGEIQIFPL